MLPVFNSDISSVSGFVQFDIFWLSHNLFSSDSRQQASLRLRSSKLNITSQELWRLSQMKENYLAC